MARQWLNPEYPGIKNSIIGGTIGSSGLSDRGDTLWSAKVGAIKGVIYWSIWGRQLINMERPGINPRNIQVGANTFVLSVRDDDSSWAAQPPWERHHTGCAIAKRVFVDTIVGSWQSYSSHRAACKYLCSSEWYICLTCDRWSQFPGTAINITCGKIVVVHLRKTYYGRHHRRANHGPITRIISSSHTIIPTSGEN